MALNTKYYLNIMKLRLSRDTGVMVVISIIGSVILLIQGLPMILDNGGSLLPTAKADDEDQGPAGPQGPPGSKGDQGPRGPQAQSVQQD